MNDTGTMGNQPSRAARVPAAQRRSGLLDAAREVFVRDGYDGASARDIAAQAGTRVNVLYRHFESKDQLFDAAVLDPLRDWVSVLSTQTSFRVERATSPQERAAALTDICTGLLKAMIDVTPLLGVALFSSSARGEAFYRDHFHPLLDASFGEAARAMGTGWSAPEFSPRFLILTAIGTFHAYALDQQFGGEPVDIDATVASYVLLLTRGAMIAPSSGVLKHDPLPPSPPPPPSSTIAAPSRGHEC